MKKKLTFRQKIMSAFNFTYAGCATVCIAPSGLGKYVVACTGFTFDGYNFFFSKNRYDRRIYNTLGDAIEGFNFVVNELTKTSDWYYDEFFLKEFNDLCLEDVY